MISQPRRQGQLETLHSRAAGVAASFHWHLWSQELERGYRTARSNFEARSSTTCRTAHSIIRDSA
eukprot:3591313-Rhodomonas_salina.2